MRRILKLLIWIIVLYSVFSIFAGKSKGVIYSFIKPSLNNAVESVLKDSEGFFGIYIKNLANGKTYALNEHRTFDAASIYKVWVMGAVYEQVKSGRISEDDPITADIEKLNKNFNLSQDDAELKEGILDFSIGSAIEQMITISHNYAAFVLIEKINKDQIENFLQKYGLNETHLGDLPKTTASDMGRLFEKIYQGEVVDAKYSQKMIAVLVRQQVGDRLPKYLPEGTKVAHKTGNLGFFENDAGIVYAPFGDYIIVILTETGNPPEAREKIAQISKAVFDYFNRMD